MRFPLITAMILASALTLGGCVTKSTFEKKVAEAEQLSFSLAALQNEHQTLQQDFKDLSGRHETLTRDFNNTEARCKALEQDLERARTDINRLETVLSERGTAAGKAMAEMRQTIDRLQTENRDLGQQVETERIARQARIAQIKSTYDELMEKMQSEIERGEITISELQGRLTVNMVDRILFDSGKADIKSSGLEVLRRVGNVVKTVTDKEVRVEGHTDNVPISPRLQSQFFSNWELSTTRANNVVHFLQDKVGIPGERLSASGFGEFRPVADNTTPEGKAQNRRIQIILTPMEARAVKPLE